MCKSASYEFDKCFLLFWMYLQFCYEQMHKLSTIKLYFSRMVIERVMLINFIFYVAFRA